MEQFIAPLIKISIPILVGSAFFILFDISSSQKMTKMLFDISSADLAELKTSVGQLKTMQAEFKTSVGQLKTMQAELKTSVGQLKTMQEGLDLKFNSAGIGAAVSLAVFAALGNVVKVLEYFDKKSERAKKEGKDN